MSLAIGAAIVGDVNLKLMYALIGQRNSGKGMLMTAIGAAFESFVDAGNRANNLLGNSSDNNEAKKLMWMTNSALSVVRLIWTSEIRTLSFKGETYIDGNLIKKIASGGDQLEVRGQVANPFLVRHEFTMFLNRNKLPPVRPSTGDSFLHVKFRNKYTEDPVLPNENKSDPNFKDRLQRSSFADGMIWLIVEEYMGFLRSGQKFKPISEVTSETEEANDAEGEDLLVASSIYLGFAPPFSTLESCRDSGFLIKPDYIREVISGLKKNHKFNGVSNSGMIVQLGHRGYPKVKIQFFHDDKQPPKTVFLIVGVKVKCRGSDEGVDA